MLSERSILIFLTFSTMFLVCGSICGCGRVLDLIFEILFSHCLLKCLRHFSTALSISFVSFPSSGSIVTPAQLLSTHLIPRSPFTLLKTLVSLLNKFLDSIPIPSVLSIRFHLSALHIWTTGKKVRFDFPHSLLVTTCTPSYASLPTTL